VTGSSTGTNTPGRPLFGAILLAGGRASRVGGAHKPLFEVGGQTLLARAAAAVAHAGARPIVVAAPALDPSLDVDWALEDPPFGGPVAGIVAALSRTDLWAPEPEWTFVLACDLPRVDAAVKWLAGDIPLLPAGTEGVCLADASSRPQWLTGAYRTAALRRAARALPDAGRDAPVRALLDDLAIAAIAAPDDLTADVDTWEDLGRARAAAGDAPLEDS
jgi:molybdopterin-guanine dinucleotide biosynthesis protein A